MRTEFADQGDTPRRFRFGVLDSEWWALAESIIGQTSLTDLFSTRKIEYQVRFDHGLGLHVEECYVLVLKSREITGSESVWLGSESSKDTKQLTRLWSIWERVRLSWVKMVSRALTSSSNPYLVSGDSTPQTADAWAIANLSGQYHSLPSNLRSLSSCLLIASSGAITFAVG